jgi:hypothetical protein
MSVMRSPGRFAAAAVLGAVIAASAAGCSAGSSSRSNSAGVSAPQQKAPQQAQGGAADKAGQAPAAPAQLTIESRSLIFTGTVTVRVSDVGRAAADASALTTGAGGFVGGDDRTSTKDNSQARMTLRVPSARFTDVVDGVARLGREESRQLSTEDVTDQVTDVDARIATGQASVDRVRDLLARAQNIGEIVSLESELERREADLESLKSRKRKLDDQTTLSTVTAVLLGPQAATHAPEQTGFLAGLKGGWNSFVASMRALLTVVGALLPWLVALAVPAAAVLWWIRRSRRVRPAPASAD